ncbi:MAG: DUF2950 family protein [Planctomycetota bacterium]
MRAALLAASVAAVLVVGCKSTETPDDQGTAAALATFPSPEEAFESLVNAARSGSVEDFEPMLGSEAARLLGAEDAVALQRELDAFVEGYDLAHSVDSSAEERANLVIGEEGWTFPIPVVRAGDAWTFDVEAGAEEIVLRRIGRNELSAIEVCRAIGDAQEEYRAMFGHYAARLLSRDGQRDGLYWPTSEDEPLSPLGELVAAAAEGEPTPSEDGERAPYLGYHYRILVEKGPSAPGGPGTYASDGALQGGYAILAWPADYASLGIMTFLMDARGVVLERDLGERTSETARALSSYDPTSEWEVCAN